MGKKRNLASAHIDFEEENEELQDEIDKFHAADRKLTSNAYQKKKAKNAVEVLNVEPDDDIGEELSSESDFDDDDDESGTESTGVIGNEWGKKRKDFYGTEYVDEDWGGMREEEMEDAELEEEDAAGRQAALDKAAAIAADLFEGEDKASEKQQTLIKEKEVEWKYIPVKKLNKRTLEIIEEYKRRKDLMEVIVDPLAAVIQKLPHTSNVRKQLLQVHDVYTSYILSMMIYLNLKSESLARKKPTDEILDLHPSLIKIEKLSKMVKHVDAFLDKNASALKKLVKKVSNGEQVQFAVTEPIPQPLQKMPDVGENVEAIEHTDDGLVGEETTLVEDRRKANKQIEKNFKAESGGKRKKVAKIAKTKNRKRYKEAVKKVRSQIGTVRREMQKYTGESRGIRVSTIKSTKLVA